MKRYLKRHSYGCFRNGTMWPLTLLAHLTSHRFCSAWLRRPRFHCWSATPSWLYRSPPSCSFEAYHRSSSYYKRAPSRCPTGSAIHGTH